MLTAQAHGVSADVLDDLGELLPGPRGVAVAATKAWRFVDEMREIAVTQRAAGLPEALFEGMAQVYELLAAGAGQDPEQVPGDVTWDQLLTALR